MSNNQIEVEVTQTHNEVRVSGVGEVIDGITFAGVMNITLNQDMRSVHVTMAYGEAKIQMAIYVEL